MTERSWLMRFRDEHTVLFIVVVMAIITGVAVGFSSLLITNANDARIDDIQQTRLQSCESGNSIRLANLRYRVDQAISLSDGHRAIVGAIQASEANAAANGTVPDPAGQKIADDLVAKLTSEDAALAAQVRATAKDNAALDCAALTNDGVRRSLPLPPALAAKLDQLAPASP